MDAKIITARALVAIGQFGVESGDLFEGPKDAITALAGAGLVDPDPAAVSYAKRMGAKLVKIAGADAVAAGELGAALTEQAAA